MTNPNVGESGQTSIEYNISKCDTHVASLGKADRHLSNTIGCQAIATIKLTPSDDGCTFTVVTDCAYNGFEDFASAMAEAEAYAKKILKEASGE